MVQPKLNTKRAKEVVHFTGYDVEVSYRSDGAMLYKSPRTHGWFIIGRAQNLHDAESQAHSMIRGNHSSLESTMINYFGGITSEYKR